MEELWPPAEALFMLFPGWRWWGWSWGSLHPFDPRCYCLPGILLSWEPS